MKEIDPAQRVGLVAVLAALALVVATFLTYLIWPAAYWFEVHKVQVRDARAGAPIEMDYDRTIHHTVRVAWSVKVAKQERGGWVSHCATDWREETYRPDAVLPDPVTLDWFAWTEPRCYTLRPGVYRLEAHWRVWPGGWLDRTVDVEGVIFQVTP